MLVQNSLYIHTIECPYYKFDDIKEWENERKIECFLIPISL